MKYSEYSNTAEDCWYYYPSNIASELQDAGIMIDIDALWLFGRIREVDDYLKEMKGTGHNGTIEYKDVKFDNQYGIYSDGYGYLNLHHDLSLDSSKYELNSASVGYYSVDDCQYNTAFAGVSDGDASVSLINSRFTGALGYLFNNVGYKYQTISDRYGFYILNRDGDDVTIIENGDVKGVQTQAAVSLPEGDFYFFRGNSSGTPSATEAHYGRFGLLYFGAKLTEKQISDFTDIIDKYFTLIGAKKREFVRDYNDFKIEIDHKNILYQFEDLIIAVDIGKLMFSEDSGVTWRDYVFADWEQINDAFIWDNGNLTIATHRKMYLSTDGLQTMDEIIVYEEDGITPMTFHVPVNPDYPGSYFHVVYFAPKMYFGNTEIRVIGNYGNIKYGANPSNVYYMWNYGANCKRIYQFGQNPQKKDDGTYEGGTTGNLLGDATNPIWIRHTHGIVQIPDTKKFIYNSGDQIYSGYNETYWMMIEYNEITDVWDFSVIYHNNEAIDRMKSVAGIVQDGYVFWISDNTDLTDQGCFKARVEEVGDITKHIRLLDVPDYVLAGLIVDGDFIAALSLTHTEESRNPIWVSVDGGENFTFYQLDVPSNGYHSHATYSGVPNRYIMNHGGWGNAYGLDKMLRSFIFTIK